MNRHGISHTTLAHYQAFEVFSCARILISQHRTRRDKMDTGLLAWRCSMLGPDPGFGPTRFRLNYRPFTTPVRNQNGTTIVHGDEGTTFF